MNSTTSTTNNLNMNLIALVAKKRSGKDTLADYLCENHGYTKYAFAGPLKKACAEIFMFDDSQVDGINKETPDPKWNGLSARTVFQIFGTEMFRQKLGDFFPELDNIKNNFWTYRFEMWYNNFKKNNPNGKVVVSDARFPNEAEIIRKLGGSVIKIHRDTGMAQDNHSSEKNIDLIKGDIEITNDGTIEEYFGKVEQIFGKSQEDKLEKVRCEIKAVINRTKLYIDTDGTDRCKSRFCIFYSMTFTELFGRPFTYPKYPESLLAINDKVATIDDLELLKEILFKLQSFIGMIRN